MEQSNLAVGAVSAGVLLFGLAPMAEAAFLGQTAYGEFLGASGYAEDKDEETSRIALTRTVSAALGGTSADGYSGTSEVLANGIFELNGGMGVTGNLLTGVALEYATDPLTVSGNAIGTLGINEGSFFLLPAGTGSRVSLDLTIQSSLIDANGFLLAPRTDFYAGAEWTFNGGAFPSFTTFGEDIGIAQGVPPSSFEIPSSLRVIDFGLVPEGYALDVLYTARIEADIVGGIEGISWTFIDPLFVETAEGNDPVASAPFIEIALTDATPVPLPAGLPLLFAGLGALVATGRRRHA